MTRHLSEKEQASILRYCGDLRYVVADGLLAEVERIVDARVRGLRFRVEAACDGYEGLHDSDVPQDVVFDEDYFHGAADAARGIRSVLGPTP